MGVISGVTAQELSSPWQIKYNQDAEVLKLRSQNMKHFRNQQGTFTAYVSAGSIHYKSGNQWLDIDNSINSNMGTRHQNKPFVNTTNNFKTYYPANPFKESILVEYNGNIFEERITKILFIDAQGNSISNLPIADKIVGKVKGNQLIYKNVFNGVDLVFTQKNDGKKVDLVINSSSFLQHIPSNATRIAIIEEVKLATGVEVKSVNSGIEITKNDVVLVTYPAPSASETVSESKNYHTEEDYNTTGMLTYTQQGSVMITNSSFNLNWLKATSRSFPVMLDPSSNYGPFAVRMATGRMTTATGPKIGSSMGLEGTNTFAWAKFNIASFGSVGAVSVDSSTYWGYFYSGTQTTNKIAKVVEMDSLDPVTALDIAIVSNINAKTNLNTGYVFSGTAGYNWYPAKLDTTLHNPAFRNNIARGYTSIGMKYLSGSTPFAYHYGQEAIGGANNALVCYLEVHYTPPPCSNPVAAGNISGNALVCGGSNTTLNLIGASNGSGITYQWQSSLDSLNWTNITGAVFPSYSQAITTDSMYFRCEVMCNLGIPAYTNAFLVKSDIFLVTTTNAYEEGFESITANNQLPSCLVATNIGTVTYTFTSSQFNYNLTARTGSKFGAFRSGCNDFFFTKGLKLTQGVTYSFSTWFVTDGFTSGWDSVALYVATAPNAASANLLPGTTLIQPSNTTYQKLTGLFTPSTSGVYRFALKVRDAGIPWYLSIDDIKVEVAQAPIVATGTKSNITISGATLGGIISSDGGAAITASGVLVSTSPSPIRGGAGVIDSASNVLTSPVVFSVNVAGLNASTTYYYRAYAVNVVGTSYGADSTFTTPGAAVVPTVLRTPATNIQAYTATVGGNITSDGGATVTASGIVYSTTPNPVLFGVGVVDSTTIPLVTTGAFIENIGGLSHSTKYYYRAYATNSIGTAYSVHDSFTTSPVISVLPYNQNFDVAGNTGWSSSVVTSSLNDWVVGTPAKTTISAAFSAPNAWVTKTTGDYSTSHDAALISPQMDFSALAGNPILRFTHKFVTESCCDGGVLEISINGGAWTKVENLIGTGTNFNTTNGTAWYNGFAQGNSWSNLSSAYSTAVNGWIVSSIALPGAAGQSNVKIRFRFISDTGVEADGWAIDNIEVFAPAPPTVATSTKANITTSSVTLSGNITNNGGNAVTASGVVVGVSPNPTRATAGVTDSTTNPVIGNGTFSLNFTGLVPATTYYYRAYAINGMGTSYGVDSTFTTNASAVIPTVLRTPANNIQAYIATVGGNITSDGGSAVIASGIVYATTPNPALFGTGVVDSTTNPVVLSGNFTINPAGLNHSTKYYYRAYATNSIGTAYSVQDSFTTSLAISIFPYSQNFDVIGINTGWSSAIVNGTLNNWVLGAPAKTYLTGALSGTQAWVTKLTGNYDDNHDAAVVSPQFDFSALTAAPILRFKHKFVTETDWDALIVEMSVNGGVWTRVDNNVGTGTNFNTVLSTSWYNSTSNFGPIAPAKFSGSASNTIYSSQVNGWITSVTPLIGASGQSNVKVRFRFGSDASGNFEGVSLDDIEVFVPSAPIVLTGTQTNITTSNVTLAGNITNNGGNAVTASGVVVGVSPNPIRATAGVTDSTTNPVVGNGTFSLNLTGLTASTTYYYRAYAVNAVGTSYGADSTFTTPGAAVVPTVLKVAATNVTTTTATVGGNITSDGGATVTASGIVYSTTPNPVLFGVGVVDSTTIPLILTGSFNINPTGLIHSTKYYYRAYAVNSVGTAYSIQDSFITSPIVSTLPYNQNFDGIGNTGWSSTAIGTGTDAWQLGTPAKTFLNGAYSGANAWVTRLVGSYLGTEDCAIVSPQFDFTSSTNTPVLRFRHKMDVDNDAGWDAGVVEISINNGAWTRLNNTLGSGNNFNTTIGYAWYNDANVFGGSLGANKFSDITSSYASQTNGWIESAVPLTGALGQSDVKIRFRFWANGFVDEGWAIDDIQIVDVVDPTTAASNVSVTPSATSANVTCTAGNGQGRMIVARLSSALAVAPTNNTLYAASAVFGSANTTGTGNFIVYMGTGISVNVTGLTALTGYTFDVYEYNGKYMHNSFAGAISSSTTTTPVKLVSLKATKINEDVLVKWTTASELNNRGFNVERSIDGKTFEFVGFVKGRGNSSETNNYRLEDANAFALTSVSKLYYRLKQVDNDGKFEYSNVISVNNAELTTEELDAYPNPFSDKLTVSVTAIETGIVNIDVVDISGRVMLSLNKTIDNGKNLITIDEVSALNKGIYFIKLNSHGVSKVVKMIKQ
jgi:hypothetical protein